MRYIIILRIVVGIPTGVFHSMFTIVNMERFELTPESNGRLLSYIGILTMVRDLRSAALTVLVYLYMAVMM